MPARGWDYVVIGAGAAGCVVAGRLSEARVALIEAGRDQQPGRRRVAWRQRPDGLKQSRLDLPICDAFLATAAEAGYPVVDDLNADVAEGFGRIDTNIANGHRASTAVAFAQAGIQRGWLERGIVREGL